MSLDLDRLYRLLPIVLREEDEDNGYPLRGLLRAITEQAALLQADMWQLYDDHFIETCQTWAIPYIGDLVGNELIYDSLRYEAPDTAGAIFPDLTGSPDLRPPLAVQSRADVANTIRYRRRKGTVSVLESLARDVTGWMAHVVEMRELLGATQNLAHLRYHKGGWTDLRISGLAARIGGPFDDSSHTVALRRLPHTPLPGLDRVAVFLWRLPAFPMDNVPARQSGQAWRRSFSPLGHSAPLFRRARVDAADTAPVTEADVPGPIRRHELCQHLDSLYGEVGGPPSDLAVSVNGRPVAAAQVSCRSLDPWPARRPEGSLVHIDPELGRLAIGTGLARVGQVDVTYVAAFSGDLGGGPYERKRWLIQAPAARLSVLDGKPGAARDAVGQTQFGNLVDALGAWERAGRPDTVISILDSRTYELPEQLRLNSEGWLAIEAADRKRPLLVAGPQGCLLETTEVARGSQTEAALTLSGVVVEGHLEIGGPLRRLRLLHSTLVPGRHFGDDGHSRAGGASLMVRHRPGGDDDHQRLRVEVAFSITGPLHVPEDAEGLWLLDSIVDGLGGVALSGSERRDRDAAPAVLERTTVLGAALLRDVTATDCIFTGEVTADRLQHGCVRFSYLPPGSHTPRRFRCQPDMAIQEAVDQALAADPSLSARQREERTDLAAAAAAPIFNSVRYGVPSYCQLSSFCPAEIRTGAEDGAEMGAFSFLKQPQRTSNLVIRLAEYLPFGLEPVVSTVT